MKFLSSAVISISLLTTSCSSTGVVNTDFSAEMLSAYDLSTQSFPCKYIAGYNPLFSQDRLYKIEALVYGKPEILIFQCRYKNSKSFETHGVLIGSKIDCATRNFDYSLSVEPSINSLARLCTPNKKPRSR